MGIIVGVYLARGILLRRILHVAHTHVSPRMILGDLGTQRAAWLELGTSEFTRHTGMVPIVTCAIGLTSPTPR